MIAISPETAFLLYLGATLLILLTLWWRFHYRQARRQVIPPQWIVLSCEYCHHGYAAEKVRKITRCPQCQSLNKK